MTILVRIASYRDPELLPTLHDCIERARWPGDLRFAICWQHDHTETLDAFADDLRFRVIDVPYIESKGMCWARALCADRYDGETFTLGLDSHHRFVDGWDAELMAMMEQVPSSKPILTSYPPDYRPDGSAPRGAVPCAMNFVGFTDVGTITMTPAPIEDFETLTAPLPSRFYAGGLSFASGRLLEQVPPDPDIYFRGEEANMGVRSFTHGYDLFHPHKIICWHEYKRDGKPKHWEDHKPERGAAISWLDLHEHGMKRFRQLFGIEPRENGQDFGRFEFGSERSLRDYETFAGIHFARQGVQIHTLEGRPPPNPRPCKSEEEWLDTMLFARRIEIRIPGDKAEPLRSRPEAWLIQLGTRYGDILHRRALCHDDLSSAGKDGELHVGLQYITPEPAEIWAIVSGDGFRHAVLSSGRVTAGGMTAV